MCARVFLNLNSTSYYISPAYGSATQFPYFVVTYGSWTAPYDKQFCQHRYGRPRIPGLFGDGSTCVCYRSYISKLVNVLICLASVPSINCQSAVNSISHSLLVSRSLDRLERFLGVGRLSCKLHVIATGLLWPVPHRSLILAAKPWDKYTYAPGCWQPVLCVLMKY